MPARTVRAAGIVTLVLAAVLGSAYAIGRSLIPDPQPRQTGVQTNATGPNYAEQAPEPSQPSSPAAEPSGTPSVTPSGTPSADGLTPPQGPPLEEESDGPYGSRISTGSAQVALTFDDGPDPQYTPQVLALLRQYGVKATFCVVGENAASNPDLIRAIVADGHTLCNHSWDHDLALGKRSPGAIRADLLRTNDAIRAAVPDARIAYFRQPGGEWTRPVVSACEKLGMTPLHWTVDPTDWQRPGAAAITSRVLTQTGPGSIVLMHDAGGERSGTVEALRRILPGLLDQFQLAALPTGAM